MSPSISISSDSFQRNTNADFIRVLAMFMVCVLHVIRMGGYLAPGNDIPATAKFISTCWGAISIIAVNLYALLTGYLCINKQWNIARFIELWILVFFYSYTLYIPDILPGGQPFVSQKFILLCNPFTSPYWYFSAYAGLFILIPFLNIGLRKISRRHFSTLLILLYIGFSLLGCWNVNELAQNGHNALWLTIMYIFGAYIKLHNVQISKVFLLVIFIAAVLINLTAPRISPFVGQRTMGTYASFSITLASVSFFALALKLNLNKKWISRTLQWLAPMAFSVYLIHCHPIMWGTLTHYLESCAEHLSYPWWFIPAFSLMMYISCSMIDWLRIQLFKLFRIKLLAGKLSNLLPSAIKELE